MFAKRLMDLAILLSAHIMFAPMWLDVTLILASIGKTFAMGWDRKQGERKAKRA